MKGTCTYAERCRFMHAGPDKGGPSSAGAPGGRDRGRDRSRSRERSEPFMALPSMAPVPFMALVPFMADLFVSLPMHAVVSMWRGFRLIGRQLLSPHDDRCEVCALIKKKTAGACT